MGKIFLLCSMLFTLSNSIWSQVSIAPETGLSYLPFIFTTANTITQARQSDYLLGITASMPIQQKYILMSRLSFTDRKDVEWYDLCTCPGYAGDKFSHSDLNIDLTFAYRGWDQFIFGVGPSAIRKFAQWETRNTIYAEQNTFYHNNRFFMGLHSNAGFVLKRFGIRLTYVRILSNLTGYISPSGQNRIDLTAWYSLLK